MPPKPNDFVLGPSLDNVFEPMPGTTPTVGPTPGRRQIAFDSPATSPGGIVHLSLTSESSPGDVLPINVYAFFVQPVGSVPPPDQRTTDWFFKSGFPSGSIHPGAIDSAGKFWIVVPGVKPSLDPYFVQTILEFPAA